ncbi:hypothetical protein RB195_009605 [Necator americanus]
MATFAMAIVRKLFVKKQTVECVSSALDSPRIKLGTLVDERRMAENYDRNKCNGSTVLHAVTTQNEGETQKLCTTEQK